MTTIEIQHEAKKIQRETSTLIAARYLKSMNVPLWMARYILLYTR